MKALPTNTKLLIILAVSSAFFLAFVFSDGLFYLNDQLHVVLRDDAMISMRYAKHWADGYGIYWNNGGSPEGYTNFLLVIIMAVVHLLFNPDTAIASIYIITINFIINALVILVSFKASNEIFRNEKDALITSLLIGLTYQFLIWGAWGFETSLLALFSILAIYYISVKKYFFASLIMALAVLTRDDFTIFVFAFGAVFPFIAFKERNVQFAVSIKLSAIPLLVFIIHLLWRNYYYGDFLPNTYYLKATGWIYSLKLQEGLKYLTNLLPVIFLSLFSFYRMFLDSTNDDKKALYATMFFLTLMYSLYVLNVGGDAFLGARLFAAVYPVFAIAGTILIKKYCRTRVSFALVFIIFIFYPLSAELKNEFYSKFKRLKHEGIPIHYDIDSNYYKSGNRMPPSYVTNIYYCQLIRQHAILNNIKRPSMAVYNAGVPPYMCSDFVAIDLLGKSDGYIAKQNVHKGKVGHNKYDYDYSIGKFKPTYIFSLIPSIGSLKDRKYINSPMSDYNWHLLLKSREFTDHYTEHYINENHHPIFIRNGVID